MVGTLKSLLYARGDAERSDYQKKKETKTNG